MFFLLKCLFWVPQSWMQMVPASHKKEQKNAGNIPRHLHKYAPVWLEAAWQPFWQFVQHLGPLNLHI